MIVAVFPGEFHGLGYEVVADFVVDVGFVGLAELVAAGDAVQFSVFDEAGTGLVEAEGDVFGDALFPEGKDPVVVAGSCIDA